MSNDGTFTPVLYSEKKPVREFNGRQYILEESMPGDFALVKGWKADTKGNVIFRKTARNFNIDCAKAAKCAIVEVEEIVDEGQLDPDTIHLPGIYIDRIVLGENYEKRISKRRLAKSQDSTKSKDLSPEVIIYILFK